MIFALCTLAYQQCSPWQSTLSKQSVSLFLLFSFPSIGFLSFSLFSFLSLFPPSVFADGLVGRWKGRELCQLWEYSRSKEKKLSDSGSSCTCSWDIQQEHNVDVQIQVLCVFWGVRWSSVALKYKLFMIFYEKNVKRFTAVERIAVYLRLSFFLMTI